MLKFFLVISLFIIFKIGFSQKVYKLNATNYYIIGNKSFNKDIESIDTIVLFYSEGNKEIPTIIHRCTNLSYVWINGDFRPRQATVLDSLERLCYLTNLKELSFNHIIIRIFPKCFQKLNLKSLQFRMSNVKVNNMFENLTLEKLLIFDSYINFNSDDVYFPKLKTLILSNTGLETIPKSFGKSKSLKYIDFSYNNLTQIPDFITKLDSLKYLNLEGNYEIDISSVYQLSNLEILNLNNCRVGKYITKDIKKMQSLKKLYLRKSRIGLIKRIKLKKFLPNCDIYYK